MNYEGPLWLHYDYDEGELWYGESIKLNSPTKDNKGVR